MIRKLVLALGATAVIGTAALAPTAASAHWKHHKHWIGGPTLIVSGGPTCYFVKKPVLTVFGWRRQLVEVCNYY
jgi:hypothetical protein